MKGKWVNELALNVSKPNFFSSFFHFTQGVLTQTLDFWPCWSLTVRTQTPSPAWNSLWTLSTNAAAYDINELLWRQSPNSTCRGWRHSAREMNSHSALLIKINPYSEHLNEFKHCRSKKNPYTRRVPAFKNVKGRIAAVLQGLWAKGMLCCQFGPLWWHVEYRSGGARGEERLGAWEGGAGVYVYQMSLTSYIWMDNEYRLWFNQLGEKESKRQRDGLQAY